MKRDCLSGKANITVSQHRANLKSKTFRSLFYSESNHRASRYFDIVALNLGILLKIDNKRLPMNRPISSLYLPIHRRIGIKIDIH